MIRIITFELRRMIVSRRWVILAMVVVFAVWLAESSVHVETYGEHVSAHAEDVYLSLVNNLMLIGYLVLPAFALVVSGSLAADCSNSFALLTLSRAYRRERLWVAKMASVVAGAVVAQAVLVGVTYVLAGGMGYPPSRHPSQFALLPASETHSQLFAIARVGDDMFVRILTSSAFLVVVFSAFGIVALAVSVKWSKEFVPPALVLGIVFFDWLTARFTQWPFYDRFSPSLHLFESTHLPTMPEATPWMASIAYFGVWLAVAAIWGWWSFERCDV